MKPPNVDLSFFAPNANVPGPARCHVRVNDPAARGCREFDPSAISPQFVAFPELNHYIDRFQEQLEAVREKARSEYAAFERTC